MNPARALALAALCFAVASFFIGGPWLVAAVICIALALLI